MNTPMNMTESVEEGAINIIQENFNTLKLQKQIQSSNELEFDNVCLNNELDLNSEFNNFICSKEDSIEISLILSNLNTAINSSDANSLEQNKKQDIEYDSENFEILNILKRTPQAEKSISLKALCKNAILPLSSNNAKSSLNAIKPVAVKKISLAGKVLKSNDSTADSGASSPDSIRNFDVEKFNNFNKKMPVRASNPIYKNTNLYNISNNSNHADNRFNFLEPSKLFKF